MTSVNPSRPLLSFLLRAIYAIAVLFLIIALAAVIGALLKTLAAGPTGILVMAAGVLLASVVVWLGLRLPSTRSFLFAATSFWLISRAVIVLLFPNFVLMGDEHYFHEFVLRLGGAMTRGDIPSLSTIYDFPVWLSRSFPFYLPLASLFGANDLWAARILNVFLGACQLIFVFFIARRLMGGRAARLSCLLLLLFPYHWINVLSYDPQIAGTFFLLLAVWMFLRLNSRAAYSIPALVGMGACLAIALLLAGIQRGGIDLLLVGAMLMLIFLEWLSPVRPIHPKNVMACLLAVCLIWFPLRSAFASWVASEDANLLRSHTLGFMTRGWNLETSGEFLPLYEQLDVVSAKAEKQRTLEAVLITEFARQPIPSLLILPVIKIAKFFAIGYASTAEQGLNDGGYPKATFIYRCLRSVYAPLLLAMSLWGLIRCWQNRLLERRLILLVLLIVTSCLAIVLVWETSPRYSHPVQFALLIVAAAGMLGFPRSWSAAKLQRQQQRQLVFSIASSTAAVVGVWLVMSACIAALARSATAYQFVDPQVFGSQLDGKPLPAEPLHSFSRTWEEAVDIPRGTELPAILRIQFPPPTQVDGWDHVSVSVWLPDPPSGYATAEYQVACQAGGSNSVSVPSAASGHIARVSVPRITNGPAVLSLSITSSGRQTRINLPLRVGIGYALAN